MRTIEKLHHFKCKSCNKWWAIGDIDNSWIVWWCPWCGKKDTYVVVDKDT